VSDYVTSLLQGAPAALATAKVLARRRPPGPGDAELEALTDLSVRFFASAEGREGVRSFLEKRSPAWRPVG
jgi:methylglutaconyl-CoA hydratase